MALLTFGNKDKDIPLYKQVRGAGLLGTFFAHVGGLSYSETLFSRRALLGSLGFIPTKKAAGWLTQGWRSLIVAG